MLHLEDWGRTWRQHLHQGSDAGGARTHEETPREQTDRGSLSHLTLKAILWNFSHSFPVTMSPGLLPDSIIFHLFCHYFKDVTISACPFKVGTLRCRCAFCRCFSPTCSVISPDWIPNNYLSIIYSHPSKSFRFPKTQLVQNWRLCPQTCYFLSSGTSHCHLLWHSVNHQYQVILSLISVKFIPSCHHLHGHPALIIFLPQDSQDHLLPS